MRRTLARWLGQTALPNLLIPARQRLLKQVPVLTYHRICDYDDSFERDVELVSATPAGFDKQLAFVAKHFTTVTTQQLLEHIQGGTELPDNPLLITFDDGFADNFYEAFPLLVKHGLVATFFVSTSYLETDNPFWFDSLVGIYLCATNKEIDIPILGIKDRLDESFTTRKALAIQRLTVFKELDNQQRLAALEQLKHYPGYMPESKLALPMSHEMVLEMHKAGMGFGSHSANHPILTSLRSAEGIAREISESKVQLDQLLGEEANTISYPEGSQYAFDKPEILNAVRATFELGFTYKSGSQTARQIKQSPFYISRLPVEREMDLAWFKAMLALPEFTVFSQD